jgi:hypothetical protein
MHSNTIPISIFHYNHEQTSPPAGVWIAFPSAFVFSYACTIEIIIPEELHGIAWDLAET